MLATRLQTLAVLAVTGLCLTVEAEPVRAQADPSNFMFNTGQTVGPIFEGWSRNADGSFEMHFGYINRNYVEDLYVPVGPDNRLEPGAVDRGQPTYFYPRIHRRLFSVTVPADWGEQRLVWTVQTRDESHQAIAWLQPEWEIFDPTSGGSTGADQTPNESPVLIVENRHTISVGQPLTLMATVTDDGLPESPGRGGGGQRTPPTLEAVPEGPTLPFNVPAVLPENRKRPTQVEVDNVTLTWTQWRGARGATLTADGEPSAGTVTVTAVFEEPGEYLFRVEASDRRLSATQEVSVVVE